MEPLRFWNCEGGTLDASHSAVLFADNGRRELAKKVIEGVFFRENAQLRGFGMIQEATAMQ